MLRRYHLQDREDYKAYNKLCGMVTKLTHLLEQLDPSDEERIAMTDELLDKCAPHARCLMPVLQRSAWRAAPSPALALCSMRT